MAPAPASAMMEGMDEKPKDDLYKLSDEELANQLRELKAKVDRHLTEAARRLDASKGNPRGPRN